MLSGFEFDAIRAKAQTLNEDGDIKFKKNQSEEAYNLFIEAITQLQDIPKTDHTPDDWRNLATYQNKAGVVCKEPQQELKWYETAIQSLLNVLEKERTPDDWRDLATYQNNAGVTCKKPSQWKQAQSYFYSSLDALGNSIDNQFIASIYSNLLSMELKFSINTQLYSFAHDVFSGKDLPEAKNQFLQLHLAIINSFDSQPNSSRRGLLQLMQLIESRVNTSHPNKDVKKWLSDKDNHEQFKKLLQEVKNANQPLSLLNAIDQAPTFSVAVANKLLMLDEVISNLRNEIQALKKENQQLKALSFSQLNSSHYQGHFTAFRPINQETLQDTRQPSGDNKFLKRKRSNSLDEYCCVDHKSKRWRI